MRVWKHPFQQCRIERGHGESLVAKIQGGDVPDVLGSHFLDRLEVAAPELRVPRHEPPVAVIGGAPAGGGQAVVMIGKQSLLGLLELCLGDSLPRDLGDLREDFLLGLHALCGIGDRADVD